MKTKVEINQQLLDNQREALRACMTVDSEMGKRLREAIFQELKAARNKIVESIRFDNGDPRGTAHAVKRYIAGKYLGGVVSILNGRSAKGGTANTYEPPRKLRPGQRGGNRRPRSSRTQQILNYGPSDRDFILRFVNSGTKQRAIERLTEVKLASGGSKYKWVSNPSLYGNRGSIAPRNFFARYGSLAMDIAIENLGKMVEEEFEKLLKQ